MLEIPQKLFDRALSLGFECTTDDQQHLIRPSQASWYLVYDKDHWVLVVHGIPQMRFGYDDVMAFLDRLAKNSGTDTRSESVPVSEMPQALRLANRGRPSFHLTAQQVLS